jgi:hypothetical protein
MKHVKAGERAERRATPSRTAIPSGDRLAYSTDKGRQHV